MDQILPQPGAATVQGPRAAAGICLIVSDSALMAEDLRELLIGEGATEVVVARSLAQAEGLAPSMVFLSEWTAEILASGIVTAWTREGAPVVLIGGTETARAAAEAARMPFLEQPFRSEDVLSLLRRIAGG